MRRLTDSNGMRDRSVRLNRRPRPDATSGSLGSLARVASWRRRALSLLDHMGIDSIPVGPEAVLLSRKGRGLSVDAVDHHTWVVRRQSSSPHPPAARRQHSRSRGAAAVEHTARILSRLEINCVLDVGANVGQFGTGIRAAGYAGRIVSFEPLATFADQLREEASQDADWRVFEYALGDTDTEMEINARPGSMSSLLPSSDFGRRWHPRLSIGRKQQVRVRRLDSLYDTAIAGLDPPRVFLKLDTQGYDLRAFAGAGEHVPEILGLQSELSCVPIYEGMPRLPEQISVYENAGFEITGMFPVTRDPNSLRVIEFDVVMVRPGAVRSP